MSRVQDTNKSNKSKSAARLYAVQALFQMEATKTPTKQIISEFEEFRIGQKIDGQNYPLADLKIFREIICKAVGTQGKIDKMTNRYLKESWHLNRIDPTLRALFRASIAELLMYKTPPKAIINEFLDVTKAFFPGGKEAKLLNGVLDKILKSLEDE
ncbi:MAG: transcription antitermination factor NusB [Pseudomonadota bacterium]|nr:transcription antitermination factor NusB [Pseudomonadota bacterium]